MVRCVAVVSLLAVLAGAGAAEAQSFGRNKVRYDRLDFRVLQTDHFDIYYYAEEEQATRHAARMAERWYARFSQLLEHTFTERQPLVLYASHSHFSQTNVTPSTPGEGVGGLTERTRSRIAMPFAAGLGETDHVLGHEIAHAFQIDIAKRAKQDAFTLPGWFIEGMAEYLSLGPHNRHTMMWLRDAALHDTLPTLDQLDEARYFPYRYGHAVWSFLTARHGDAIFGQMLRSRVRGVIERLEAVTGADRMLLTREWHESVHVAMESHREEFVPTRAAPMAAGSRLSVAPSLSPDGRQLMFVSERDRLSLGVFIADAASGAVTRRIVSTATDPHFDSLQYIHSSGTWDRSGRRFAMIALGEGRPVLVIIDTEDGDRRTEIRLDALGEAYNPSWSPDGDRIVFSGLQGGLSDLFIYTVASGDVRPLTADVHADLHPAWSPDGATIAFATDRFTSRIGDLEFGPLRIGLLDVTTGVVHQLLADDSDAKQVSPQWSPAGDSVYFIGDRTGASNVYRSALASGGLWQVTDVPGGVSGITSTSPALAVAARAGTLAFSVYRDGRYEIHSLDAAAAVGVTPHDPPNAGAADARPIARLLANPREGLPVAADYPSSVYVDRLRLETISPPYVGAATGNGFGGLIRASVGIALADMLRDRQLQALFRIGTDAEDLAVQVAYTNRSGPWNWGVIAGLAPSRFVGAHRALERAGSLVTRETANLRYSNQWGGLSARYNFDRTQRVELGAGIRRTGFVWQTVTRVVDVVAQKTISRVLDESPAGRPIYVAEGDVAFVRDTVVSGPTAPLIGQRLRLSVSPAVGSLTFADVRLDARRYFMPVRPVTLAMRVEHSGRYGPDAHDTRLTPLILGLETLVRGYSLGTFLAEECGATATTCSPLDELTGGRFALVNMEVRAPLLGLLAGDLYYGPVPIEVFAFADAGFMWTRQAGSRVERDRFRSVGAGARVNMGGFVFEAAGARPFDRAGSGWTLSLLMRPGF